MPGDVTSGSYAAEARTTIKAIKMPHEASASLRLSVPKQPSRSYLRLYPATTISALLQEVVSIEISVALFLHCNELQGYQTLMRSIKSGAVANLQLVNTPARGTD